MKTKDEIEAERREVLRRARIRNYAVKRRASWRCQVCESDAPGNLVVVVPADGDDSPGFELRCAAHRQGLQVAAGQMDEIEQAREQARK